MKSAQQVKLLQLLAVLWAAIYSSAVFACPDDQYEQCLFGSFCYCLPKAGGDVGKNSPEGVKSDKAIDKAEGSTEKNKVDIEKLPDPCKIRKLPECE